MFVLISLCIYLNDLCIVDVICSWSRISFMNFYIDTKNTILILSFNSIEWWWSSTISFYKSTSYYFLLFSMSFVKQDWELRHPILPSIYIVDVVSGVLSLCSCTLKILVNWWYLLDFTHSIRSIKRKSFRICIISVVS